ncbi:hypothetical protein HRR83_002401 [Exophiala dermatitidis]|uniref:Uncharacterized protein n=1 Tax=Exophiala dermatitidis TaxID=5970 RepID=A0AAN6EVU4_EXODE|nr:hypothetical protein HRR74_002478 [Exophiala dermatitidis]KAJ4525446.1 hypothetical protein HRR73_002176 [Exophiala dermatitidis]KAJ4536761.1 hypothetical protein HRR76_004788 [Exophiala dermatitidis]KAJ4555636.1 hypothetical protein HRR77_001565 [Exophiala dermatitidis]KAJ4568939.1 hypothetical protein HRR81_006596 [Exophiala dermatitidis]
MAYKDHPVSFGYYRLDTAHSTGLACCCRVMMTVVLHRQIELFCHNCELMTIYPCRQQLEMADQNFATVPGTIQLRAGISRYQLGTNSARKFSTSPPERVQGSLLHALRIRLINVACAYDLPPCMPRLDAQRYRDP